MKISLNNVWLTNDGATDLHVWTDAHGLTLNGQQVVQDAQFLRAISAQPLARGNAINVLRFAVTRQFSSVAAASSYVLTAFSSLPTSGTATLICGALGETPVTCTFAAVLAEMPASSFRGTRTDTVFVLRGGAIRSTAANVADVFAVGALNLDGGGFS